MKVYHSINGHYIRWDEGVSAKQILQILLNECCGNYGSFDKIIILFDEFGRFLEYASANPGRAGDSALQQIFEAVQNAEGDIQFIGFIQADIKAYLQRVINQVTLVDISTVLMLATRSIYLLIWKRFLQI